METITIASKIPQNKPSTELTFSKLELQKVLNALQEAGEYDLSTKLIHDLESQNIYLNLQESPMSYKDFTLESVTEKFDLKSKNQLLFEDIEPISKDELGFFYELMERNLQIGLVSEKARSEAIIFPLFSELLSRNKGEFSLLSGKTFDVEPETGLKGRCDFLLSSKGSANNMIYAPVFAAVEAKQGMLHNHIGQCAAEMVAARIFNKQKKREYETIFGVVTSGTEWLFLKLENDTIVIDTKQYYEVQFDKIIAICQFIVDFYKVHR
ncbi:MAG: hypothetical protein AB8B69_16190 [Chitinophagales bacterium]